MDSFSKKIRTQNSLEVELFTLMRTKYRGVQKFVPLISCTIIFDPNLVLHREHVFRISVTGMPFFFFIYLFIFYHIL